MTEILLLLPFAYLLGSVNFALVLLKALDLPDPRGRFSGNAGTTNVYRQAGWLWAAVVLLLEMGRAGAIATLALWLLPPQQVGWVGLALILANRFPFCHGFKGGKGVAAYLGFTAIISPLSAGLSALSWVGLFAVVRIPFVASFLMISVLAGGNLIWANWQPSALIATLLTLAVIVLSHRSNLVKFKRDRSR